ncbi:hypothetical protein LCGC14_1106980 [marine sediment metagenome]|uniref:Transcription regulator TrmB N-terminal domain-containing protein n=1 Tax=marine sediment metagenome TaxID=412755 RepID=A0A0F9PR15_9ZZZZ
MATRLSMDVRMLDVIERSSRRMAEQVGSPLVQEWGSFEGYREAAEMEGGEREVYVAIREGVTDPDALEVTTGLPPGEVRRVLEKLKRKGLIEFEEVE